MALKIPNQRFFFSITIPTYEMHGYGVTFLEHSFKVLNTQSFKNFEIIISDHSLNNDIYALCQKWSDYLNIKYLRNDKKRGSSSANINYAIRNATGEWIKILFQDDFLYHSEALMDIYNLINEHSPLWIATACEHTNDGTNYYRAFYPRWNNNLVFGQNTISSPSVISIKNENNKIYFDENLIWLMDVEYYHRMYKLFGEPYYLNKINVVNRVWGSRLSDTIPIKRKKEEEKLLKIKYGEGFLDKLMRLFYRNNIFFTLIFVMLKIEL